MKKYIILIILTAVFFSCTKDEDNPNVKLEKGKYFLRENPKGEVQEFIYTIHKNYGTIILPSPDSTDFKYNFTSENKIKIKPAITTDIYSEELSEENKKILLNGFKLLKENLLDIYNDEFKKNNLPLTIQLCDEIKQWDQGEDTIRPLVYVSHNMIAISGINSSLETITPEKIAEYKLELNSKLFLNKIEIPQAFFDVSKDFYFGDVAEEDNEGNVKYIESREDISLAYKKGFIDIKDDAIGSWGYYHRDSDDIELYINYLFSKPQDNIKQIVENYPLVKIKYDILRYAILKAFNYDIKNY